jgi:hypothetical protein
VLMNEVRFEEHVGSWKYTLLCLTTSVFGWPSERLRGGCSKFQEAVWVCHYCVHILSLFMKRERTIIVNI